MRLERFEDAGLAQYAYAVVADETREVAIVDPLRDVDGYLEWADAHGLKVAHLETHIHADFASGGRELAKRTGAALWLSAYDDDELFEVEFPHRELRDGEEVRFGEVRVQAVHTPGHTPEHMAYLVYDTTRAEDTPVLMLTGDFLFVGSLGRPDLLGEDAKRALAERMFDSVRGKLAPLPDGLEVYPGHGAGSMCGAGMSGRPYSTLGYERATNPYLEPDLTREGFVERLLTNVPPFPDYYRRMKRVNSQGPVLLEGLPGLAPVPVEEFHRLVRRDGHVVIDLRDVLGFGAGHIPGAYGIEAGYRLAQWGPWVVPYDTPILLVAPDPDVVPAAVRQLVRVGLDDVRGYLEGGIQAWVGAGYPLAELPQITPTELAERLEGPGAPAVLDVRGASEWEEGHIAGAHHVMLGELPARLAEVPRDRAVAIVCRSGSRSTIAASVLERAGFEHLANVIGGMGAWGRAGLPITQA